MNTLYSHLAVDTNSVIKPASPQHVPQVGTNVEVMEDTMEGYLQRPHHTLNMKRTMGGTEDREASGDERTMDTTERGRRDKMFKFVHGEFQLQKCNGYGVLFWFVRNSYMYLSVSSSVFSRESL